MTDGFAPALLMPGELTYGPARINTMARVLQVVDRLHYSRDLA